MCWYSLASNEKLSSTSVTLGTSLYCKYPQNAEPEFGLMTCWHVSEAKCPSGFQLLVLSKQCQIKEACHLILWPFISNPSKSIPLVTFTFFLFNMSIWKNSNNISNKLIMWLSILYSREKKKKERKQMTITFLVLTVTWTENNKLPKVWKQDLKTRVIGF